MQPIKEFISELEMKKIKLWVEGDKLSYKAPTGIITQDILNLLRSRKQEIIDYFKAQGSGSIFYAPIEKAAPQEHYPLSAAQLRMFLFDQIDKNSIAYNLTQSLKIEGEVDQDQLKEILNRLVARHESLRTAFKIVDGIPVQKICEEINFNLEYEQIENTKENIDRLIEEFIRPYDLAKPPLFKFKLVKLLDSSPAPSYLLIHDMHHIISDGVSEALLVKEVNDLFVQKSLPELKIQYKDYAAWHQKLLSGDEIQTQKQYWLEQLNQELPLLNLPTDYPRPQVFSYNGESVRFQIHKELADKLYHLARENRVTLFTVLIGVYSVLLARYTGQNEIIIGTPTAGRRHLDTANIIGVFVNTLALKVSYTPERSFPEFIKKIGEQVIGAFDNQDYPFENLVDDLNMPRDLSRNPIIDTMFILQNMNVGEIKVEGLGISRYEFQAKKAQFDITMVATENKEGIEIDLNYCTSLFRKETIARFGEHYKNIISCITEDPQLKLGEIDILSLEEKSQILSQFNDTTSPYDNEKTIHELFEAQVEKTPEKYALVFGDKQLTYRELNEKANQIAKVLRNQGITRDNIVGIMVERSFAMIIGILGILKAGGAYLPIDPNFPAERIKYMVEDSKTVTLLTQKNLKSKLEFNGTVIDLTEPYLYQGDNTNLGKVNDSKDLAYVIYTSGSTGNPKGVMIEHCAVHNFIHGITARIDFSPAKTILALTTISFDIFVLETLLPLSIGAKVVIAGEKAQKDPKILKELITQNKIDMLQVTPSRLQMLFAEDEEAPCLRDLMEIMIGGEALPPALLEKVRKVTGAKIYNMYGPTETTVWSSVKDLTTDGLVNIGKPIANTYMYILDSKFSPQPAGIPGELYIAGDGIARGYLNNSALTTERFVPNPFYCEQFKEFRVKSEEFRIENQNQNDFNELQLSTLNSKLLTDGDSQLSTSRRMYRTGDLARLLLDGEIDFLGRIDYQVKIRGFRIELGEIEHQFLKHEAVKEAAVIAREDKKGEKNIYLYFVAEKELTAQEIRGYLARVLPDYMIPSYFIQVDKMPKTMSGKIDRRALPASDGVLLNTGVEYEAPQNETESRFVSIWQEVLGLERVGVNDNFFAIGGDSIKGLRVLSHYNKYNLKIIVEDLFKYPTIRKLSEYIRVNSGAVGKPFIDDDVKALEIPEVVIIEKEKFNIIPFHYSALSCSEALIASIMIWLNRNFELMFTNSWGFAFMPGAGEGEEFIPLGSRVTSNMGDGLADLQKYHGMQILTHARKSYTELLEIITTELEAGRPVAVSCDTFWVPWDVGFQREGHEAAHFFLITGYDFQNRYVYCVDSIYFKNWEPLPIEYLIKGNTGQCFSYLILDDENLDIGWKEIIRNAVLGLKGDAESENAFNAMRRFAEEMKATFDVKIEIGIHMNFLRCDIYENLRFMAMGRKQFGMLLEYITRTFDIGELMGFAKRLERAGRRWETIRALVLKMNSAIDTDAVRMKIYETIMIAADDEERISEELFKLCDKDNFTSLDKLVITKKSKNTGNGEFVFVDLSAYFNNKGCGSSIYKTCKADINGMKEFFLSESMPGDSIIEVDGMKFKFACLSDDLDDNIVCSGGTINVPNGNYANIIFMGCSVEGSLADKLVITYQDGMTEEVNFEFSFWWLPPEFGETVAWTGKMASRINKYVHVTPNPVRLYAQCYPLRHEGKITNVTLPDCPNIHLFAISLEGR